MKGKTLSIYAFGDRKPKQKTAPIVEIKIQTGFGKSIKIKATVIKQISGPLQTKELEDVEVTIWPGRYFTITNGDIYPRNIDWQWPLL